MAVKFPEKAEIIQEFRLDESDTGSTPVQIAVLTHRIKHLTEHLKKNNVARLIIDLRENGGGGYQYAAHLRPLLQLHLERF